MDAPVLGWQLAMTMAMGGLAIGIAVIACDTSGNGCIRDGFTMTGRVVAHKEKEMKALNFGFCSVNRRFNALI